MADLRVAVLDVGHGDFIYATTPFGDNLVIDVGMGDIIPSQYLSNVTKISELQISHPHTDHFDDILNMSRKEIKSFRCPNLNNFADSVIGWRASDKPKITKLRELRRALTSDNAAVRVGNEFDHTVWFADNVDYNDPNTASIVTTLKYKGVKILFGGDLPEAGWENLLEKPSFVSAIKGTKVFKAPHHGREDGCCQALFDIPGFEPLLCLISDKSVDDSNENTIATNWYTQRSKGCNVVGYDKPRKVLTTRSDGSIFIKVNEEGTWWVYPNTSWKTD